jgi:hypothetical protein
VVNSNAPRHSVPVDGLHVVKLKTEGQSAAPMRLDARMAPIVHRLDGDQWTAALEIRDKKVSDLRFGQESDSLEGQHFLSTIRRGSLTLEATEDKRELVQGEPVAMTNFAGKIDRLSIEDDGLHVVFGGSAGNLRIGPAGFNSNLAPSLLDVANHTHWVFALGAFLSALGALASCVGTWHKMREVPSANARRDG